MSTPLAQRLAALRVDTTPLRTSPDFRRLFWGGSIFWFGGMFSYVALPFQLYDLTGSNFAVGALGLVELVPLIIFGLYGGALADRADRRTILLATSVAQVVLMAVLLANALTSAPRVWLIYVVGALYAVASSLQRPAREALMPRTVRHEELPAATVLNSLGRQVAMLAGPALAGVLIGLVGVSVAYTVDVAAMTLATVLLWGLSIRGRPQEADDLSDHGALRQVTEGLRYAISRRDLLGTYLVDMVAMVMAMPIVLWPALAADVLQQPEWLGVLYSAEAVGALIATSTSGWTSRVHHHGRAVVLAAMAWGAAIAVVGVMPSMLGVVLCLMVAGAMDMISGVFRSIIWNQTIPDHLRGRLAGIEMLSYSLGPMAGEARAGLVADAWSVRGAITSGGIACVGMVALTGVWLRDFWRYDARTDEHAVAERERRARLAAADDGPAPGVEETGPDTTSSRTP